MKYTTKNLEKLASNVGFNPEKMGIALLRSLGYKVETYLLSGAVCVQDKSNKKILYYYDGVTID